MVLTCCWVWLADQEVDRYLAWLLWLGSFDVRCSESLGR
jgi:hypothetical protein